MDPRLVDRSTGEILDRHPTSTVRPVHDTRHGTWPPRSKGPLPTVEDLNIATALDELDAWAVEYDREVERFKQAKRAHAAAVRTYELEAAKARRKARQNPTERGRRTSGDIDAEVVEATHAPGGPYDRLLAAETEVDVAKTALFAAKDQMMRMQVHISAAKNEVARPGP